MCCKGLWHGLSADRGVSIITFIAQYAQVIKNNRKAYLTSACRNQTGTKNKNRRKRRKGRREERQDWRKRSKKRGERKPTFPFEGNKSSDWFSKLLITGNKKINIMFSTFFRSMKLNFI